MEFVVSGGTPSGYQLSQFGRSYCEELPGPPVGRLYLPSGFSRMRLRA